MALVNPNIAMGYRALELPQQNALVDYAAVQQIQSNRRQGEVADMQLEKMKRDEASISTMMKAITDKGGPPDPMIKSGVPHFMDIGLKLQERVQQNILDRAALGLPSPSGTPAAAPPNAMTSAGASNNVPDNTVVATPIAPAGVSANAMVTTPLPNVMSPATPPPNAIPGAAGNEAKIRQAKNMLLSSNPGVRTAGEQQLRMLTSEPTRYVVPGVGLVDPRDSRVIMPSVESTQPDIKQYEYARGQGYKGSFVDFKREMAIAGRTPAQPRVEQPPVAVVGPDGKPVYVSRDAAISGRMTPANAQESLSPKEIQKREATFPQATSSLNGFDTKSDKFIKDLEALRDHPGLNSVTGLVAGRAPGLTGDGRAAQALYDKVVAKGGFQALQDMRDASKTGGALGNVSNQEGKQLIASFAAIDRRQNAEDVRAAINQVIADIQGAKTRMREAFDATYSYKSGNTPTPAVNVITNPKFPGFSIGK